MRILATALMAVFLCSLKPRRINMRAFLVAVLSALFLSTAGVAQGSCDTKHTEMLYTVVLVDAAGGSGSGTVIYSGERDGKVATYVLTNFHVIQNGVNIKEEWDPKKGKKVEKELRTSVTANWFDYNDCSRNIGTRGKTADIVAYDKSADLALLKLHDTERPVFPVAQMIVEDASPHLGDEVWAVGAGMGEPPFMTKGNAAFLDKQINGHRYIMATAPIIFGNSGGALFRFSPDRDRHELIGVPSRARAAGWQIITHMAWSIPMSTVRKFLRDNDLSYIVGDKPKDDAKEE